MTKKVESQFITSTHKVTVSWSGEGSVWATGVVVPPPASPEEYADVVTTEIHDHLLHPRPNISVSLLQLTDTAATYEIDGGGETIINYGFSALTAEQCTLNYIGHCMLLPIDRA